MTIRQVAAYLKIKEKTACRRIAGGKIPGFKGGGSWRFRRSELVAWIERRLRKTEMSLISENANAANVLDLYWSD